MKKDTNGKTIEAGYKEFINTCKVKNLSEKTIIYYNAYMNKFMAFLKQDNITLIKDINKDLINTYIIHLKGLGNQNDISINTAIRAVRAIIYFFQGLGYCNSFKINLIKANKTIKETYTEHELKLLLDKPDFKKCDFSEYRDWVIVNFLLATGVRVGELVNIRIGDIDLDEAITKVKQGKSRRERHLPLSKTINKILMEYLEIRQGESPEDYLFCNSYGQKFTENSCTKSIARYNNKRGINKTSMHLFRHTFAKMFILNGGDVFRLQKILGHRSIEIVKEYVNMFTNDLKKDFDNFNPLENINKSKGKPIRIK
ncbi:MAG TPA: tyrosine-type recombinase/integrase [Pseudobacteroides sp.]|uniref:tyrosine-type recombinase/integrase n=1 Tax=Pseudobacteroides sp. TaxID=1968840 RepID=UPI002F93305B